MSSVDLAKMKNLYNKIFEPDNITEAKLSEPGVDVNWKNADDGNKTLLIQAIASNASDDEKKRKDIVKMLLDNGADTGARDDSRKRALDYSIPKDYYTIQPLLWAAWEKQYGDLGGGRKSKRSKRSRKSKRSKRSRKSRRNRRTKRR